MKKVFKSGCLGIIGLVALIVIVGMFAGGEESGNTVTDSEKRDEAASVANIGQTLQVGDVAFTVNGKSTAKNLGGEYGVNSQGTFLVLDVTVTNKGSEAITVDSTFFKLTAGEKTYDSDGGAGVYANTDTEFFLQNLNPDLSANGKVVFDVTDEVISNPELLLNVQTGLFGTETGQIKLAQ